jgi:hypothetical protein
MTRTCPGQPGHDPDIQNRARVMPMVQGQSGGPGQPDNPDIRPGQIPFPYRGKGYARRAERHSERVQRTGLLETATEFICDRAGMVRPADMVSPIRSGPPRHAARP